MRSVIVQADEHLLAAAEERARLEHTTLDEQFQRWLADYAREIKVRRYNEVLRFLRGKVRVGRKLTRDEMNARCAREVQQPADPMAIVAELQQKLRTGEHRFTRDEMNGR